MLQTDDTRTHRSQTKLGLELRTITLSSGDISYVDEGRGTPVLLLHGAPLTSLAFLRVIRELRKHYRVVAPDLPGFGLSRASPDFAESLEGYSRFVSEFCGALDLRQLFLFVNDASACFGLHAAGAPGTTDRLAGIVIAGTVPIPLTGRAWLVGLVLRHVVTAPPVRALNRRFNLLPWLVATVAPLLKPFSREERATFKAQFDTAEKRDRIIDMFARMGHDDTFMRGAAQRCKQSLSSLPALLLFGQFDPMRWAGGVSRYRRLFPNSTVRILPFEDHFPVLASGTKVGKHMHDWISSIRSAAFRPELGSAPK